VKASLAGMYSFLMFLSTVVVAFADEAKKEGGYAATAYVWIGLIVVIVIYGIYDSFFKPVD
jgi:uncharacterized membrane protein